MLSDTQDKNPYKSDTGEPLLKKSVVAFIDILGYKGQVKKAFEEKKGEALLRKLRKAFDETYDHIKDEADKILPQLASKKLSWIVKGFTDNIVIGYPIKDDAEPEMGTMFSILSYFQLMMIIQGFFIRGGIDVGELYMDDEIIFGNGLLEAYEVEQNLASDPRIVLSKIALKYTKIHISYYARPEAAPQIELLLKDRDGQVFINYLSPILEFVNEGFVAEEELLKHKEVVELRLKEYVSEPAIWSKYFWVANYHNWFCDQSSYFNESYKIDLSKIPLGPGRII